MDKDMEKMMGFSSFGSSKKPGNEQKKAKTFNYMEILEQSIKVAKERNKDIEGVDSDDSEEDDEVIGPLPPPSPGGPGVEETSEGVIGPLPPSNLNDDNSDDDDEEGEDLSVTSPLFVPCSHHISLDHGSKSVTALAFDVSGARLVSGGLDFQVSLWDFGGMDANCRPFRTVSPCGAHHICDVAYSAGGGEHILVVSGSAQAHIMNRNGESVASCQKGYPYISDAANAQGHTHGLTSGTWHPRNRVEFLTASMDGTIRTWDCSRSESLVGETLYRKHITCVKVKTANGQRGNPTCVAYSRDGYLMTCGCADSSLMVWDTRRPLVMPTICRRNAHALHTEVTSLAFAYGREQIVTRGLDDRLLLWDLRKLSPRSEPLLAIGALPVTQSRTDCGFSPNDRILFTGTSANPRKDSDLARLVCIDRETGKVAQDLPLPRDDVGSAAIRLCWHPRLNQIAVGGANGSVQVYFDIDRSSNGAKLCAFKTKRAKSSHPGHEAFFQSKLLTYNEESESKAQRNKKRSKFFEVEERRENARSKYAPQPPVNGPDTSRGETGRKGASLHQYMVQQIILPKSDDPAEKDIRAAILRHDKKAKENPLYVSTAYEKTQPKAIFQNEEDEEETEDRPSWKKQKLT